VFRRHRGKPFGALPVFGRIAFFQQHAGAVQRCGAHQRLVALLAWPARECCQYRPQISTAVEPTDDRQDAAPGVDRVDLARGQRLGGHAPSPSAAMRARNSANSALMTVPRARPQLRHTRALDRRHSRGATLPPRDRAAWDPGDRVHDLPLLGQQPIKFAAEFFPIRPETPALAARRDDHVLGIGSQFLGIDAQRQDQVIVSDARVAGLDPHPRELVPDHRRGAGLHRPGDDYSRVIELVGVDLADEFDLVAVAIRTGFVDRFA
jgi:hypothetical protein